MIYQGRGSQMFGHGGFSVHFKLNMCARKPHRQRIVDRGAGDGMRH